jgi:hypothetical protein
MMSDNKTRTDPESAFSYGVRELEQADAQQANVPQALSMDSEQPKAANEKHGFDPYNTSGSFDRKKHWVRVGRR